MAQDRRLVFGPNCKLYSQQTEITHEFSISEFFSEYTVSYVTYERAQICLTNSFHFLTTSAHLRLIPLKKALKIHKVNSRHQILRHHKTILIITDCLLYYEILEKTYPQ